jgi:dTDP-4-dehydrorhamnose reductase
VVVNTAAVADVDRCEADPDLAFAVNAAGPGALARVCAARGLPLIHISTDYVFTAEHGPAFTEQDAPNAASVYGRSKAEGERRVLDAGGPTCVARVAWLFGHDQDFLHTMLRRARAGEALRVFDQTGVPTPMGLLSDRLGVLAQMMADKAPTPPILHLCGGPPVTRAGWLGAALDVWSAASSLARPPVEVAPPAALRPRFSALDSSLAAGLFGAPLPWRPAAEAAGREG